jgi:hypothetical protein
MVGAISRLRSTSPNGHQFVSDKSSLVNTVGKVEFKALHSLSSPFLYTELSGFPRFLRMDSPSISMRWAL